MPLPDFSDPFAVQQFLAENERQKAETLADIERRRSAEPLTQWRAPEPEPMPQPVRRDYSREWSAYVQQTVKGEIASLRRQTLASAKALQDANERAFGMALGRIRRELQDDYQAKLDALTTEVQQLRALVLAQDEGVLLPMDKALRRRAGGDAA